MRCSCATIARERRDHWEKTAHSLLVGAILHVLYAEQEKTLARVATFLADPARSIRRTLWIMLTTNHLAAAASAMLCIGLAAALSVTISRPAVAIHIFEVDRWADVPAGGGRSGVAAQINDPAFLERVRSAEGPPWRAPDLTSRLCYQVRGACVSDPVADQQRDFDMPQGSRIRVGTQNF